MALKDGHSSEAMVTDSNEAVEFKLIRQASDLESEESSFQPVMSHQIFGPQETIYGYKDLHVKLYFSAALLNSYLGMDYSEKVDPKKCDSTEADDIASILKEKLEIDFSRNQDDFIVSLEKEMNFRPFGELKHSFSSEINDESCIRVNQFEIYYCEVTTPGFLEYHRKLQTFILWFIDAASFIAVDDDKWKFFLVFEKYNKDGDTAYAIAGYATVYEYYAYPINIRPRLSQMLILPPFQRRGLGAELLTSIYNHYKTIEKVTDITVEDPSEELQLVRDYVDAKNCLTLESFYPASLWSKGFTPELVQEAAKHFKINKKQARRVYEILKFRSVKKSDEKQYQQYRLEVKRRLNLPNHNEQKKWHKLEKFMKPQELAELKASFFLNDEQRIANLDKSYKELEALYERVCNRLDV